MNVKIIALGAIALPLAYSVQAHAQPPGEKGYEARPVAAPTKALEVVVGTGYTQGFGSLQEGVNLRSVATAGISADLAIGYRIDPRWAFSVAAQYQEFDAERASAARGLTGGLALAFHISPYTRVDPWIQIGTGYRMLWETHSDPTPNLLTQGFEPVKLTLGLDVRVSKDVAIAPVIGGDLTVPLWQSVGNGTPVAIADPRVGAYVFAGLQARFDVTSAHVGGPQPPQEETQTTQATVTPPPAAKPAAAPIDVSAEVLAACKLNLDNADTAPKFEFDKSEILPSDVEVLSKVAECFSTGPLKDANMRLVGHTDPRGTPAYNMALGTRRANSVAAFMEKNGVAAERIERLSRGEKDATGTDEGGWARDRRVDVGRIEIEVSRR